MSELITRNVPGTASTEKGRIRGYGLRLYDPTDPGTEFVMQVKRSERSRDLMTVHERIVDRAHLEPLTRSRVVCAFNHDKNRVLGCTESGTCTLTVDARGIEWDALPLPGDDIIPLIERGDITGSSFMGHELEREIDRENGIVISRLKMKDLLDIGPVTYPAYKGTTASSRDISTLPELSKWIDQVTLAQRRRRRLVYFGALLDRR